MLVSNNVPSVIVREDVHVRYVEVADTIAEIQVAWPALEALVGHLQGHRFIGAFDQTAGWYRACVEIRDESTRADLDLPDAVIPGGRYLRVRLKGEPPAVYELIGPTYGSLERHAARDETRPSLEVYRRHDAIDILMPVA